MFYAFFIVALTLACVAAVGFAYLMFLDATLRQHKRRIAELERQNAALARRLQEAEEMSGQPAEMDGEVWPEVVDGNDYPVR